MLFIRWSWYVAMIENLRGMDLVLEAWSVESVVGKYHEESEREERGPMGWSEGG